MKWWSGDYQMMSLSDGFPEQSGLTPRCICELLLALKLRTHQPDPHLYSLKMIHEHYHFISIPISPMYVACRGGEESLKLLISRSVSGTAAWMVSAGDWWLVEHRWAPPQAGSGLSRLLFFAVLDCLPCWNRIRYPTQSWKSRFESLQSE